MIVRVDKSFIKSLNEINDTTILQRIKQLIVSLEEASTLKEINNIKRLKGFKRYHRIRMGDYRLGFEVTAAKEIRLIVFAHRKDIYRSFP